jgi:hypothetical protein
LGVFDAKRKTRRPSMGHSDLMAGGWTPSTSRVAAFDVFGKAALR